MQGRPRERVSLASSQVMPILLVLGRMLARGQPKALKWFAIQQSEPGRQNYLVGERMTCRANIRRIKG